MSFALWFHAFDKSEPLRRLSPLLFAWALGMGWSVVYTGEHYVVDAVAGYAWAAAAVFLLGRVGILHAHSHEVETASDDESSLPNGTFDYPRAPEHKSAA